MSNLRLTVRTEVFANAGQSGLAWIVYALRTFHLYRSSRPNRAGLRGIGVCGLLI